MWVQLQQTKYEMVFSQTDLITQWCCTKGQAVIFQQLQETKPIHSTSNTVVKISSADRQERTHWLTDVILRPLYQQGKNRKHANSPTGGVGRWFAKLESVCVLWWYRAERPGRWFEMGKLTFSHYCPAIHTHTESFQLHTPDLLTSPRKHTQSLMNTSFTNTHTHTAVCWHRPSSLWTISSLYYRPFSG